MRASFADPVHFPELPVGRLRPRTIQRVSTAVEIHHRAGPWARCSEDFSRVVRVGLDVRPAAALSTPSATRDEPCELDTPLTLPRRAKPAFA